MFRDFVLKLLGLKDKLDKIEELENERKEIFENFEKMNNRLNNFENELNFIKKEIENINQNLNNILKSNSNDYVKKEELKEITSQLNTLSTIVNGIITNISDRNNLKESHATVDNVKDRLLELLKSERDYCITELIEILEVDTRKFYNALNELKKEGRVEIVKKGRAKIMRLKKF